VLLLLLPMLSVLLCTPVLLLYMLLRPVLLLHLLLLPPLIPCCALLLLWVLLVPTTVMCALLLPLVLLLVPAGLLVLPLLLVLGMCLLASSRRLLRISTASDVCRALLLYSTGTLRLLACLNSTSGSFSTRRR
jgi:hypothetical protein